VTEIANLKSDVQTRVPIIAAGVARDHVHDLADELVRLQVAGGDKDAMSVALEIGKESRGHVHTSPRCTQGRAYRRSIGSPARLL
jgi:predicted ThiF/HesA family dinucleotide-utilizing enzyme